jgi:hypothetical protein
MDNREFLFGGLTWALFEGGAILGFDSIHVTVYRVDRLTVTWALFGGGAVSGFNGIHVKVYRVDR